MRAPFSRPALSIVFYVLAGIVFLFYLLFGLGMFGGSQIRGNEIAAGLLALSGLTMIAAGGICGAFLVAIGYVIELLAKIEWNTRPNTDEMGYVVPGAAATPSPYATLSGKRYYLREKGQDRGPYSGADVLGLYRDGKVSFATTVYVEEEGQRRPLKNLTEINP